MKQPNLVSRIRIWLAVFVAGLILSGVTAFPLESELDWLARLLHQSRIQPAAETTHLLAWVERVSEALATTNARYPFLAYGTD